MPWRRFANISLSQAIIVREQSGDTVYCIPFSWLDDNFDYLKNRIYIGNGAPIIYPEQDKAWYIDKLNQILYWWDNENDQWKTLTSADFELLIGSGPPNIIPSKDKALYIDKTNDTFYWWDENTSQWRVLTSTGIDFELLIGSGPPNITPSKDKALYIDRTNSTFYWWDKNSNQWRPFLITSADTVDGFHASLTPQANTILPLNANVKFPNLVLSDQIREFENPIDLTNANQDYFLQVGEVAKITFSNTTSVPLRIATQNGTYYELHLIPSNTGGTSGASTNPIYLNPNNTTYYGAFRFAFMRVYISTSTGGAEFAYNHLAYPSFRIGENFSCVTAFITNRTVYKNIRGICDSYGTFEGYPLLTIFSTDWRDTSTSWTSLGTIVFPQNTSGVIYVRRLM